MMSEIETLLERVSRELSEKHAKIMEFECRAVCNDYGCKPEQLILEFHVNTEVHIKIDAIKFRIENIFTVDGKPINQEC